MLFFTADDGANGYELWKSDGTAAGTVMIKDINPGAGSSSVREIYLTRTGGKAVFSATDGVSGIELWQTDGTDAGTERVQDIATGSMSSSPKSFVTAGSNMFLTAYDETYGWELRAMTLEPDTYYYFPLIMN